MLKYIENLQEQQKWVTIEGQRKQINASTSKLLHQNQVLLPWAGYCVDLKLTRN